MKKNIAYKVAKNLNNLPDGFITEHMETDEDVVEGFLVIAREAFSDLMANNVILMSDFQKNPSIQSPNRTAGSIITGPTTPSNNQPEDVLFQQFLAWKASQGNGS